MPNTFQRTLSQSASLERDSSSNSIDNTDRRPTLSKTYTQGILDAKNRLDEARSNKINGGSSERKFVRTWQLGNLLGAGAYAKVFLGMNMDFGTLMAVKQIEVSKQIKPSELKDLEREIELMSQLKHPHIVRYLGMERNDRYIYIFLDYIPGGNLEDVISDFALPENVIRRYVHQILLGLKYLHDHQIIHRDIKASNTLLDEFGTVYLADFGCSKKITTELKEERALIVGTPNYMAPEVIETGEYTPKADIWSLGCTILQMSTRKHPWDHVLHKYQDAFQFFYFLKETKEDLIDYIPSSLSDDCRDFIKCCLIKDPKIRPSAEELLKHAFIVNRQSNSTSTTSSEIAPSSERETVSEQQIDDDDDDDFDDIATSFDSDESDEDFIEQEILELHSESGSPRTPTESPTSPSSPRNSKKKSARRATSSLILPSKRTASSSSIVSVETPVIASTTSPRMEKESSKSSAASPSAASTSLSNLFSRSGASGGLSSTHRFIARTVALKRRIRDKRKELKARRRAIAELLLTKTMNSEKEVDDEDLRASQERLTTELLKQTRAFRPASKASLDEETKLSDGDRSQSVADIQKFLQQNAFNHTNRMLQTMTGNTEYFQKFAIRRKKKEEKSSHE